MTCIEFQRLITPYIDDKLELGQLNEFMNHLNNCPDCKEELEVYYTLLTGMKQLDEDKNLSGDFHLDFINKLKRSEERIIKRKICRARKKLALVICVTLVSVLITFSRSIIDEVKDMAKNSNGYSTLKTAHEFTEYDFYKKYIGSPLDEIIYRDYNQIVAYTRLKNTIEKGDSNE